MSVSIDVEVPNTHFRGFIIESVDSIHWDNTDMQYMTVQKISQSQTQ